MQRVLIVVPAAHTFFWLQSCMTALQRFKPANADIVVVYNSPWCPAIRGITETRLGDGVKVVVNAKHNKFHASALDYAVEQFGSQYDYLMAWETDVLALAPDWLDWFFASLKPTDYATAHYHHEKFLNPSCTLYRTKPILEMLDWCRANQEPDKLRWGERFENVQDTQVRQPAHDYAEWFNDNVSWIVGPFADKRGWPAGTVLKEPPSGQHKGPGWYEPGQMLHHWAVQAGYTYTVCPTWTWEREAGLPMQTVYGVLGTGGCAMEAADLFGYPGAKTAHLWGGTRALDILKHPVECNFVRSNTPMWLAREARFWRHIVPADVQAQTLDLIRKHGWHTTSIDGRPVQDRDREAAKFVEQCYLAGGIEL